MRKVVHDPSGFEWNVRRDWVPRWAAIDFEDRFKWYRNGDHSLSSIGDLDFIDGIVAFVVSILFLVILVFFIIPLLLIVFDLVVLIALLFIGAVTRVLFRRPWLISAESENEKIIEERIVGLQASKEKFNEIVTAIESGNV